MSTKVAINGLGRIGRSILKLVIEEPALELVAVNDLAEAENLAYLLRFETAYGRYAKTVMVEGGGLAIAGCKLRTLTERDPLSLPWKEVHGTNVPQGTPKIISCASCTTNCITPVVEIIGRRIGFQKAAMTTVHAYTSSQSVVDGSSRRWRRGRAAGANPVPAKTGAALATTRALPEYAATPLGQ